MINIAISGASGKMGRVAAQVAGGRKDCVVVAGIDVNPVTGEFPVVRQPQDLPCRPDVIVDFSHPSSLDALLEYCLLNGSALVAGTTGYSDAQIEQIRKASHQIPIFFTFNMSLGINLLLELAKKAAAVLGDQFDIEVVEKHHNQKIDAPSGTAIMIAETLNKARGNTCQFVYDRHSVRKKREKSEIGLHSIRGGTIVGEHDVIFAGRDEVITLSHQAASKEVFAVGAVNAAVFLSGKPAGLYDMSQLI